MTSLTSAVGSRQDYYTYGTPRNKQGVLPTDKTFTGQRAEAASMGSLMDFNARAYSPVLGRFAMYQADLSGMGLKPT